MRIASAAISAVMALAAALPAATQQGTPAGLTPPKKDVPFLVHADNLLETETAEARKEQRKDEVAYSISGASSPAKTPLAEPEFVFESSTLAAERLQLFKLESRNGQREILMSRKNKPLARRIRVTAFHLAGNVFRIRVDESLEPGEYGFSPEGSNQVFCFAVE